MNTGCILEYEQEKKRGVGNGCLKLRIQILQWYRKQVLYHRQLTPQLELQLRNQTAQFFTLKSEDHIPIKIESDEGMGLLVTQSSDLFFITVYANLDFKPVDPPLLKFIKNSVKNLRSGRHGSKNIIIAGDFDMDRRMDDNPTGTKFALKRYIPHK